MLLFSALSACGVKKIIPKGEHLLRKNRVVIKDLDQPQPEAAAQILHRPNKRVLFQRVPFFLWMYSLGTSKTPGKNDSTKIRRWLRKQGEPPVLLDTNAVKISATNLRNFFFNKGYLDAKVGTAVKYTKRKATVTYNVWAGKPFIINSFFVEGPTPELKALAEHIADSISNQTAVFRVWKSSIDVDAFDDARKSMSRALRDMGFYTILPTNFRFEVDTLWDKKEAAVYLILENQSGNRPHERWHFGGSEVNIETNPVYERLKNADSVRYPGKLLVMNHYPLQPRTLARIVYFDSGALYSQSAGENTYQSLLEMGLFNFVDIRYNVDTGQRKVSTYIFASTNTRLSFSMEPQGLYSPQGTSGTNLQTAANRSFGAAGIISFTNRNLAGNAEKLSFSSLTSYERIFKKDLTSTPGVAFQQGFNVSLTLPHFNLLNKLDKKARYHTRYTVLSLTYQYEQNPFFTRHTLPASITFQFSRPKFSWFYTPVEISFNRNELDEVFKANLGTLDSLFVAQVFAKQFISAAKVGFFWTNNKIRTGETYIDLRMSFETSGNLHALARKLKEQPYNPDSTYRIFNVVYSTYAKTGMELRIHQILDDLNTVAFKLKAGVGLPYGNGYQNALPYDKRYFIGGSASLRGWRPRRIGPGDAPANASVIARSGELLLESSIEYRFTVIRKLFYSAIFVDAGNIWNLDHKYQSPAAQGLFRRDFLLEELAVNTGIGFRFDFSFFLFRVDWGWPIRDPSKPANERWVLNEKALQHFRKGYIKNETALTIGIGYPF